MKGAYVGVARPYAKAVFERASEEGTVSAWHVFLKALCPVLSDPEIVSALTDPRVGQVRLAETLNEILDAKISHDQRRFLTLLAENKRLGGWAQITEQFEGLTQRSDQAIPIHVSLGHALSSDLETALKQALSMRLGHAVKLHYTKDPAVLGGMVIAYGDTVLDGSLAYRIEKLSQELRSN